MNPGTPDAPDDAVLAARAAAGDREALQAILERHAVTAAQAAWSILGRKDDALDAAQEALISIAREIRTCWKGGSFRSWVVVSARRAALNLKKGNKVRQQHERKASESRVAAGVSGPDETSVRGEELDVLREELAALPPQTSQILAMHHIHGLSVGEIAAQTGITADACKQRLSRGRDQLSGRLRRRGVALAGLALFGLMAQSARAFGEDVRGEALHAAARAAAMPPVSGPGAAGRISRISAAAGVAAAVLAAVALSGGSWTAAGGASAPPEVNRAKEKSSPSPGAGAGAGEGEKVASRPAPATESRAKPPADRPQASQARAAARNPAEYENCPVAIAARASGAARDQIEKVLKCRDGFLIAVQKRSRSAEFQGIKGASAQEADARVKELLKPEYEKFHHGAEEALGHEIYARFVTELPEWARLP